MTKIKRIAMLVFATFFMATFLAGCALFALDVQANNNLVVARIAKPSGGEIIINKRTLTDAYESWGFQFMQQGLSARRAVERTLDELINREIMVYLSMQDAFFGGATNGGNWETQISNALTEREYEETKRRVFDAFTRSVEQMTQTVRNDRDLPAPPSPPETPQGQPVFTPYEHYIFVHGTGRTANRNFNLNIDRFNEPANNAPLPTIEQFITDAFAPRDNTQLEIDVANEVRSGIERALRARESGLSYRNNEWQDVMYREINRMLRVEKRQTLFNRFQDMHSQGMMNAGSEAFQIFDDRFGNEVINIVVGVDENDDNIYWSGTAREHWQNTAAVTSQPYVDGIVRRARDQYMINVRAAEARFRMGLDTVDSIRASLTGQDATGLEGLHWLPQSMIQDYFTVSHVLIQFTPEDSARMTQLEADLAAERITLQAFQTERDLIRNRTTIRARDNQGHEVGEALNPTQVLNQVRHAVQTSHNPQLAFRNQIYRFSERGDGGMINNPEFEYVIGIDRREIVDGERVGPDTMSGMVPEFTDASRALRATNRPGEMSGLVWSQFGAHIIMYTRNVSDFIFSNHISLLEQEYHNFLFATQTSYGNQTFFDSIVADLTRHEFSEAERGVRVAFRQQIGENGVRTYPTRFRSLSR